MTDFFGGDALVNLRDHLLPGLWPLLAAFVICAVFVPLMIRFAPRIGVIAMPSERHAHSKPTPKPFTSSSLSPTQKSRKPKAEPLGKVQFEG